MNQSVVSDSDIKSYTNFTMGDTLKSEASLIIERTPKEILKLKKE